MKVIAFIIVLFALVFEANVSLAQTASAPGATVANSADKLAAADSERSAAGESMREAWLAYQRSIVDALVHSARPRDWILAAEMSAIFGDTSKLRHLARDRLIELASQRAPDDVVVQWMLANAPATRSCAATLCTPDHIANLTRREPDNAAVWLTAAARASQQNDPVRVDDALARMASSDLFDDHFADTLHAWLDVYDRYPPPPALLTSQSAAMSAGIARSKAAMRSTFAFTSAMTITAATAIPSYTTLVTACTPDRIGGLNWQRHAYCEDAGRLMLNNGKTFIARSIGFALLRNLDVLTDSDRRQRRNLD